ncbi:MAG: permease-like cell division protein FtsX [Anaerolineae bacterium]|jgi:cell division transport system permease protein
MNRLRSGIAGPTRAGVQRWLPEPVLAYLRCNAQVLISSLGRLYRSPVSTLMTAAVLGIALALPTGLLVLLDNLQRVSLGWDGSATISLFLEQSVDDEAAAALAEQLRQSPRIQDVRHIRRSEALEEFRALSGFGEALNSLEDNPLPAVLVVKPSGAHSGADAAQALAEALGARPEVELAQLDLQWVQRFTTLMEIGRRGILVVGALLGLAVLLIVGNTIRLDIQNRRAEIEVTKLIGATDAFIRRPFLYTGLWYGLFGAGLAWLLVELSFLVIADPVEYLAGLYQSSFLLRTFDMDQIANLLLMGATLGLAGSWLAVGRHLAAIEPR